MVQFGKRLRNSSGVFPKGAYKRGFSALSKGKKLDLDRSYAYFYST